MTKIDKNVVERVLKLSALKATPEEIDAIAAELEPIIGFIDQIKKLDTSGLKPTAQVTGLQHVTRSDTEKDYGVNSVQLLALAAETEGSSIKVPNVQ